MANFRDKYAKQRTPSPISTEQPPMQRGKPFQMSSQIPEPFALPSQAEVLNEQLQELARRYLSARHRSGIALLESARWLSEARAIAQHGEWQLFLEATATSADTAERLLHIHALAMQNPHFAEAVAQNWLGQSAAAELARPSTPPEVIAEVLAADNPPTIARIGQIIQKVRRGRSGSVDSDPNDEGAIQNPQTADFGSATNHNTGDISEFQNPQTADFGSATNRNAISSKRALQLLIDAAAALEQVAAVATTLPTNTTTINAVRTLEQAIVVIRQTLEE